MFKTNFILIVLLTFITLTSCKKEDEFDYPLVFTGAITGLTDTSAIFNAKITNTGKYPILESGFVWGVRSNDNNGLKIINAEIDKEIYSLKTNVKLLKERTYYVRAYIKTEETTSYGRELNFKIPEVDSIANDADTGKWTQVYYDQIDYGWIDFVQSSFTIDGITFISFYDGTLYSYNHQTNTFSYELTNAILSNVSISFVYHNLAYIFSQNVFYLFNPRDKSFTRLAVLNENVLKYGVSGFLIDDNIYVGLGSTFNNTYLKDFWKYNISNDSWQQIASFPGEYRGNGVSFSIGKTGYVGGGFNLIQGQGAYPKFNDLWSYFPEFDQWLQKEPIPIINEEIYDLEGVSTENFGYCYYKKELFEFNPTFGIWEKMAKLDININLYYPHVFAVNNKIFTLSVIDYDNIKYFRMWVFEK